MSKVTFSSTKGFYLDNNPLQPAGTGVTIGFDLLDWNNFEKPLNDFDSSGYTNDIEHELETSTNKKLTKKEKRLLKQEKRTAKKNSKLEKIQQEVIDSNSDDTSRTKNDKAIYGSKMMQNTVNVNSILALKAKFDFMFNRNLRDVHENEPIARYGERQLLKQDIRNLNNNEWLNDNNIAFFYEIFARKHLAEFVESTNYVCKKNCMIFLNPSVAFLLLNYGSPELLQGIISSSDLQHCRFIFIPVNDNQDFEAIEGGSHWSLVIVSLLDSKAFIYDTLDESENNSNEALKMVSNLNTYLKVEHEKLKEKQTKISKKFGFQALRPVFIKTPQQVNGNDCGVHVLQITSLIASRIFGLDSESCLNFELEGVSMDAAGGRLFMLQFIDATFL